MKLAILTRFPERHAQNYFVHKARARGHEVLLIPPQEITLFSNGDALKIFWNHAPFPSCDLIHPFWKRTDTYTTDILHALRLQGTPLTRHDATLSSDKRRAMLLLSQQGFPVPCGFSVNEENALKAGLETIDPPYIFKLAHGSCGRQVFMVNTKKRALSMGNRLIAEHQDFIVQECLQPIGQDVRAIVLNGKVIAAMTRTSQTTPEGLKDFRANLALGGQAEKTSLSQKEEALVCRAVKAFSLDFAGVDFMRTPKRGPVLLELNQNPGMEGIEAATGIDVAGALLVYWEERCKAPIAPCHPLKKEA